MGPLNVGLVILMLWNNVYTSAVPTSIALSGSALCYHPIAAVVGARRVSAAEFELLPVA